jgi:hypothetical protein
MVGRVDELVVNTQRRIGWIILCLPFVISLATSATRSTCRGTSVTHVNVAWVYRQSFEQGCTRVKLAGVKREWSRGCTHPSPASETCAQEGTDPMPTARWLLGVLAAIAVVGGLWRRSLASITIDHGARTVRIETEGRVAVFAVSDRPVVVKDKKGFLVQASSQEPISIGKGADPRDITLLRELLASLPNA